MRRARLAQKRGPTMSIRMRFDSYNRFMELVGSRLLKHQNALKGDILSQAIDELYEKELGKPHGK